MKKIILCLVGLVLVSELVFAESKKQEQTKSTPRIEKLGKVLFLEIIEENWDTFESPFAIKFKLGSPSARYQKDEGILRINEREENLKKRDKKNVKGYVNFFEKFNGKGRNRTGGGRTEWLYDLPYKVEFEEHKWEEGKGCFSLETFFYVKAVKKIKIQLISYDGLGNSKFKVNLHSDEYNLTLKPMETWESKIYKRNINPKEYIYKYTSKKNIPLVEKVIKDWDYRIPETVEFTTKITIKNYGLVEGEIRVIP